MYTFYWPWILAALPIPLLIRMLKPVKQASITTVEVPFLQQVFSSKHAATVQNRWWRNILPWVLLLLAASRPQWIGEPVALPVEGRDLMLAIDISGSMEQRDMQIAGRRVDRLTAVKKVASDFVQRRSGDRIGLILFGENAYLQTPLTFDRQTVNVLLNEAAIGLAGKATAIGDAIGLAVKKARETENNNRVLIILTDGQNTAGAIDPLKAAELARKEQLKVYTIGVGADEMVIESSYGIRRVNPSSDLDETKLRKVAAITGGQYFRARDTRELDKIYKLLDEIEPLAEEEQFYRPTEELYLWPLSLFLLLFILTLWTRRML